MQATHPVRTFNPSLAGAAALLAAAVLASVIGVVAIVPRLSIGGTSTTAPEPAVIEVRRDLADLYGTKGPIEVRRDLDDLYGASGAIEVRRDLTDLYGTHPEGS